MILVDASVLSHVFRRAEGNSPSAVALQFRSAVEEGLPLSIPGVVLQEILSGVRDPRQFNRLQNSLDGFPRIMADERDHIEAARLVNLLRGRGITATTFDALIAAMTILRSGTLFTLDRDFESFSRFSQLRLLDIGASKR